MKIERKSSAVASTVGDEGRAAGQSINWRAEIPPCGLRLSAASRAINAAGPYPTLSQISRETNDVSAAAA
jgi:hypothetical protein